MTESDGLTERLVIGEERALEFLIGGIQHYFNNKLGGVIGYTGFLAKMQVGDQVSEKNVEDANIALGLTEKMVSVLYDLRIATSTRTVYAPMDIYKLVNEVLGKEGKKETRGVLPAISLPRREITIDGELQKLEVAVRSILGDAQFCYKGGDFSVDITEDGEYASIRFDYRKANESQTLNCKEALGLFLAYQVAKAHHGDLVITSYKKENRETVELKLPIKQPQL